ncbi:MAG: hypothetical protein B7X72_08240 [Sphingobacteriia bacterium 39-39-8]|nr:MAG: hypothetical protein B7X72_08240 [Sphingobacteriia bacterium 39-39-8]
MILIGCNANSKPLVDFPLAKGNQWTYAATIKYHDDDIDSMITKQTNWLMEVVDVIPHGNASAVIIKGFPTDLVWYEGKADRGNYLLLVDSNKVYLSNLPPEDSLNLRVKDTNDALTDLKTGYNIIFDFPLVKGKTWGADPEMPQRSDSMYAWVVQNTASLTEAAAIKYNTNPDHSIFEFKPGVGITGYQFEHHGTVMTLDMKLISQKNQ